MTKNRSNCAPKGTFDLLPYGFRKEESWQAISIWHRVEETIRRMARIYALEEIRTPLFESTEIFQHSSGESSDVVMKEMYTFYDRADRSLTLRPELTASIVRAFIEHRLADCFRMHRLFYMGPMFRYSRPQAGRYRQFHQFGVEFLGMSSPEEEVELIDLMVSFYRMLGVSDISLLLNTLGTAVCRRKYVEALSLYLMQKKEQLSADSQRRLETNPLRILDSKEERDRQCLREAPQLSDFLSEESKSHFSLVQELLTTMEIPYTIDSYLVRGLDYYNGTVFEVVCDQIGAQSSIGGGGRYDGLVEQMGGRSTEAIGFSVGIERVILTLLQQNGVPTPPQKCDLFLIAWGEEEKQEGMLLARSLREEGFSVWTDFSTKKLQKSLRHANRREVRYVLILGEEERAEEVILVKEMQEGTEKRVPHNQIITHVKEIFSKDRR